MKMVKFAAMLAVMVLSAQPAKATVFGSALLSTSNIRAQVLAADGVTWTDATLAGITVNFNRISLNQDVTLNGATTSTTQQYFAGVGPFDVDQAELSTGATVPTGFSPSVPIAGPTTDAFVRADATGGGTLLTAGGLNLTTIAEIEAGDGSIGDALSNIGTFADFELTASVAGTYRLLYDATTVLSVNSEGPFKAFADVTFSSTVNQAPNSIADTGVKDSISGTASFGPITRTDIATQTIILGEDETTLLTLTQRASVEIIAVPEPSSALCFGAVGLLAFARRRRRA